MIARNELNPYAPLPWGPLDENNNDPNHGERRSGPEPSSIGKLILRWTFVCGFAAAPSFFLGYLVSSQQVAAMLLGIACFIGLYVYLDSWTQNCQWRKQKVVRRVLIFCYSCRVGISILYPLGITVDMVVGLVSMAIVGAETTPSRDTQGIESEPMTFLITFALTIIQGVLLNIVLAAWGLLSLAVIACYQFVSCRLFAD